MNVKLYLTDASRGLINAALQTFLDERTAAGEGASMVADAARIVLGETDEPGPTEVVVSLLELAVLDRVLLDQRERNEGPQLALYVALHREWHAQLHGGGVRIALLL